MECDIEIAAKGVVAIMRQAKGDLDSALRSCGFTNGLSRILEYYTENIDIDMYPLLMLQEANESYSWVALPNIDEEAFYFNIYGLVHHDNPEVAVKARRRLAGALKKVFLRRHLGIRVDGLELEFASVGPTLPPLYAINYNVSYQSNPMVRGFVASVAIYCHPSVPDTSGVV